MKVPQAPKSYKKFSRIAFVNPTASVYGTFMNELSIKADDVDFVQPK
ncbi:hypothetical protein [Listeria innocua]|nr:hypothetical protein [Listeria innocua]